MTAAPQTVCPSLKRRLTLDVTARVTRIGRAEPQTRRASRGPTEPCFRRNRYVEVAQCRCGRGGGSWCAGSVSRRDRHRGSGDAQARRQTCGQIPSTDVLLRGGADGIRALSADQEAWPRLHRGGALGRARRILVEAAWSYRHPPRVSREKQIKVAAAPRAVREIAWKAQMRLCGRFRSLTRKGKRPTVVATAIARELSAFIWAINREVV